MTQAVELTEQQAKTFNSLANRYPSVAAAAATDYIYATGEDVAEARGELAKLFGRQLFGAGNDQISRFIEFMLEVAELRAVEALRPRDWPDLAHVIRQMDTPHPTGGE